LLVDGTGEHGLQASFVVAFDAAAGSWYHCFYGFSLDIATSAIAIDLSAAFSDSSSLRVPPGR